MILQFTVIRCWWLCSNQWTGWYRYSIKPLNRCVDLSKLNRSTLSSVSDRDNVIFFVNHSYSSKVILQCDNGFSLPKWKYRKNLLGKCLAYCIVSRYFLTKPHNFIKIVTAYEHAILPYALANCIKVYKCLYLS